AEVGKTGDVLHVPGYSVMMWTELKPSAVLKGAVNEEELNRLPLAIKVQGNERLPKRGEAFVCFIGDRRGNGHITKLLPRTEATLAAIEAAGDLREIQNAFAAAMAREDPNSAERAAHFAWLDQNEYVRRYGVRRIGWYGGVLDCAPRPGGGWRVR